jgi:poly-gamma-glutamate synthesis protein (capsule biosynthesis protein)
LSLLSIGAYPVDRRGFDGRKIARAAGEKPGTLWSDEAGLSAVQSASATGAFTVVLVHGGLEWSAEPTRAQRDLYRSIVRKGARLVIGSHPHVLQGLESYGNGLIAFSMGNFLFPGMEGMAGGTDSAILRIGIFRGDIRYVQVFPVRLEGRRVRQDPAGPARAEILQAAKAFVEKQ